VERAKKCHGEKKNGALRTNAQHQSALAAALRAHTLALFIFLAMKRASFAHA
jgi:hypothetical protein